MTGVRLPADLEAAVLKWARLQRDKPSKAEAIRRLVERALVAEPPAPSARSKGAPKAAEMASREINKLGDETATDEERATRRRRLISGRKSSAVCGGHECTAIADYGAPHGRTWPGPCFCRQPVLFKLFGERTAPHVVDKARAGQLDGNTSPAPPKRLRQPP